MGGNENGGNGKMGMGMKCCHGNGDGNNLIGMGGIGNSKIIPTHL